MTNNTPDSPDLLAIAREAEAEILTTETVQQADATSDDAARALSTAELGYYEAELTSLRNAATTLNEAEQSPE